MDKKEYYQNIFNHITEMFPNGTWLETMKRLYSMGKPNEEVKMTWEELQPLFIEIVEEYAVNKGLYFSQLTNLLF